MEDVRRSAKASVRIGLAAAAVLMTASAIPSARAATYYWDPTLTAGTGGGGSGTWSTSVVNWYNGTADVVWSTGNTATFGGPAGVYTVTLGTAISAAALNFNVGGYTVAANGANTLTTTSTGTGSLSAIYTAGTGVTNTLAGPLVLSLGTTSTTIAQTWNVSAGDVLNLTGSVTQLTTTAGATGSGTNLTLTGGGTVNYSGTAFSPFKFTLAGGTIFNSSGTVSIPAGGTYTGIGDATNATLNVTAGSFTTGATLFLGNNLTSASSTGTINLSGGTITTTSTINLGDGFNNGGNGTGVINITGGLFTTGTTAGAIRLGNAANGSGTITLGNGAAGSGTLATNSSIAPGTGAAGTGTKASIFNFNGGTLQALGASLSISSGVTANVLAGGALIDTNGNNVTLAAGLLHGTGVAVDGGLTKTGGGILTLTGTSTYNGTTTINNGVLNGNTNALANYATAGKYVINSGGVLSFVAGTSPNFTSAQIDTARSNATFNTGSAFGIDNAAAFTYGSTISGGIGFAKLGTGTLTLSGPNSYIDVTSMYAGTVAVANVSALGTGAINLLGSVGITSSDATAYSLPNSIGTISGSSVNVTFGVANTGALTFAGTTAGSVGTGARTFTTNVATTINNGFSGSGGSIVKAGAATLTLNGASTFTGGLSIGSAAGLIVLGNSTAAGVGGTITVNGQNAVTGTIGLSGGITVANTINLVASRDDPTITGIAHVRNVSGNNTITLPGSATATTGGGLTINAGGAGNIIQSDAGTLTLNGSLAGSIGGTFARPYYFGGAGNGIVTGTIYDKTATNLTAFGTQVTKYGTGKWTLNGNSLYTGGTAIGAGTLVASNTFTTTTQSATGTGTVSVNSGGTLAGRGQITGAVNVNAGGIITAGDGATVDEGVGTLTNTGTQTWTGSGTTKAAGGTYTWKLGAGGNDLLEIGLLNIVASAGSKFTLRPLNAGGTLALGTSYVLAHVGGLQLNGTAQAAASSPVNLTDLFFLDLTGVNLGDNDPRLAVSAVSDGLGGNGFNIQLQSAPEPTSALLAGVAGLSVFSMRRRGRRQSQGDDGRAALVE